MSRQTATSDDYEPARRRIAGQRARPPVDRADNPDTLLKASPRRSLFRRGPWENVATGLIAVGILMLMQPFALSLFTYSFVTILFGTVMFIIVSHFPE